MIKRLFVVFGFACIAAVSFGQDAPNLTNSSIATPNSQADSKAGNVPVNIYTGVPIISVPIYNFSNNSGIGLSVSLGYNAGGIQVLESPSSTGLGWRLNAGGAITRTVRGAPDDKPSCGFLNTSAIPSDYRSNGSKYYFDTLDTQQDIFQYDCDGRSGKFVIGKAGQIVLIPDSKVKITYTTGSYTGVDGTSVSGNITSFTVRTEDGTKYIFSTLEKTIIRNDVNANFRSNYANQNYVSAWYLSSVISPFNTDTIRLYYTPRTKTSTFPYPQTAFFKVSNGTQTKKYSPFGTNTSTTLRLDSILFPQKKKIKFNYTVRTSDNDVFLTKIQITDSVFRFGYLFDYDASQKFLTAITPITSLEKTRGYQFTYYNFLPVYIAPGDPNTGISQSTRNQNARDHWGYYNGFDNLDNQIPSIGGPGANRNADSLHAIGNALKYMYLPGGGYVYYEYELNDRLPYLKSNQTISISGTYNTTTSLTLTDIVSSQHNFTFNLANTVSRTGNPPLSGTCTFTGNVVDAVNTNIVYATCVFSLYDLFYNGTRTFSFNLPDGNYKLITTLTGGGSVTGSFPITVNWENKTTDNSKNAETVGGLRIKRTTRKNATDEPNGIVTEYKYVRADGKSSGFLGDIPRYDYPYQDTVRNGTTVITSYTAVSSEPLSTMNYSQGSPVGYSRVEVYKGTATQNMGKQVYEFTNLRDVGSNFSTASFPFAPTDLKDWGLGLPEKVSVYDSIGTLLKRTTNEYSYPTTTYSSSDYKNIKLGWSVTTYNGDATQSSTSRSRVFVAQEYYPSTGRAVLNKTIDTIYQSDGSKNISYQVYTYDPTYYNISKITSKYDSTRGLSLETRIYYPYNYTITGTAISKLRDSSILTIPVSTEKWITGDGNDRIVSGNITDFQQISNGNIVPSAAYALQSNKPLTLATITAFNPASLVRNSTYFVQQSSIPSYDANNNPLQVNNVVTNQSASMIMDYANQYAIAKVQNAAYADIAYTSFESDGTGNWTIAGAPRDNTAALTGKLSYNLSNGNVTKTGLTTTTSYLVTVWAKSGATVNINGSAGTLLATQNGWNLYSKTITGVTSVPISGSGLIDELRLHPKDANMVTTAYEPNVGPISICDANNTVIYNEYDNLNRLKLVRDKDRNILKKMDYTDSALLFTPPGQSTIADWQPNLTGSPQTAISCKLTGGVNNGTYDSIYIDRNPYSSTYNTTKNVYKGNNHCSCPVSTDPPSFKIVNSVCEEGLRYNTATNYVKDPITNIWSWQCTYHYEWSDGTKSGDYTENNSTACALGLYNP